MNVLIENGKIICKRKILSKEISPTELEKSKRIRSLHCFSHGGQICIGKRLHLLPERI